MAEDRNGKPLAVDNLVQIPVRPIRALQIDPNGDLTQTIHAYAADPPPVEHLTGRVLAIDEDGIATVDVDGAEEDFPIDTRLLERIA